MVTDFPRANGPKEQSRNGHVLYDLDFKTHIVIATALYSLEVSYD